VLSTGTSLVPDLPFTLQAGDLVTIQIDEVGSLESRVADGKPAMSWLARALDDPARNPTAVPNPVRTDPFAHPRS
jgi:2-dehydro-3-deoxy-D-arabinonate dehydratase